MSRVRGISVATTALVAALMLSGCVQFSSISGMQVNAHTVQIELRLCKDDGCNPDGEQTTTGTYRLLLGMRVPKGSKGPDHFHPVGKPGIEFAVFTQFGRQLNRKAPKGNGYRWIGYVSSAQENASGSKPNTAKIKLRFTIPHGLTRNFGYRPTIGYLVDGSKGVDCGDDVQSSDSSSDYLCVDDPSTKRELRKNLKIPLD